MDVYTRPRSPYWYADVTVDGKRQRRSLKLLATGTQRVGRATAEKAADRLTEALEQDALCPGKAITVAQAVNRYVAGLVSGRRASAVNQGRVRDKILFGNRDGAPRFHLDADMPITDITPALMGRLVAARQAEGNSAQTIAHECHLLRAAMRDAAALGFDVPQAMVNGSLRNPWRVPEIKEKTRYLSWDEWQGLYAHLDPDVQIVPKGRCGGPEGAAYQLTGLKRDARQAVRDLLVAVTMTGGRWSEVAALTWDRVDLVTRTVKLFGTKDAAERLVPLPDAFYAVLERRWVARSAGPLVFPGRNGAQRGATCRGLLRAMRACGLNRADIVERYGRATVHSLRHTFASWLLQNGADLAEVQDSLGHASVQMTRRYAHLAQRKTVVKMGGILDGIGKVDPGRAQ